MFTRFILLLFLINFYSLKLMYLTISKQFPGETQSTNFIHALLIFLSFSVFFFYYSSYNDS